MERQNHELEQIMAREVESFFRSWNSKKRQILALFAANHSPLSNNNMMLATSKCYGDKSGDLVSGSSSLSMKQQKI